MALFGLTHWLHSMSVIEAEFLLFFQGDQDWPAGSSPLLGKKPHPPSWADRLFPLMPLEMMAFAHPTDVRFLQVDST